MALCILTACSNNSKGMSDKEIIDTVVDNFMLLTKVPRPSHYEEKISNWLVTWAKEQGFNTVQDSVYNVMFGVPATKGIEEDIKCTVTEVGQTVQVVSKAEKDNLIKYITEVIDGVYTMSQDMEGLVESSSNLGIVKLNQGGLLIAGLIRSSSPEKEVEIVNNEVELAKACNYEAVSKQTSDAWPYDPNSKLLELSKKIYKKQNKVDVEVVAVHAGLECGTFKKIKPDLDMISIGPDLTDGHTINETIYLNSIPKVWRLLEGIIKEY